MRRCDLCVYYCGRMTTLEHEGEFWCAKRARYFPVDARVFALACPQYTPEAGTLEDALKTMGSGESNVIIPSR